MGKRKYDWKAVQHYHDAGHGFRQCSDHFGMAHATWKRAILLGLLVPRGRCRLRVGVDARQVHDWAEIQAFYDSGNSFSECRRRFKFANASWYKAVERGDIRQRATSAMPLEELLAPQRWRAHLKRRLMNAGLLANRCSECGLGEWQGKPLSMHLDHINGIKNDNRLENLRMLCPNCHSQTPTYSGRNVKRRASRLHEPPSEV